MQSVALRIVVVLAAVALTGCQAEPPYNVLLISYDTLRADHLSLYGYPRDTSPNLDLLGEQAVVFESAIAQASSTYPSHMSLFQSRYASGISPDSPMLAELLKDAGYSTAAFTGGGNVDGSFGFDKGFDIYKEARPRSSLDDSMSLFETWLKSQQMWGRQAKPFFVFLHTYEVHHPYDPPPPFDSMFFDQYQGRITGKSTAKLLNKLRRIESFSEFEGEVDLPPYHRKKVAALYDGGIRYADSYLARIKDLLFELDLWDKTIVVFLSDHGEEFWEHNDVLHSFTVFQEVIRVPLVMKLPNQRPGGLRIDQQVRLMDVAPTLLDLLDIPIPETMLGRSLLPMIDGERANLIAVSEMGPYKALVDPPNKLILDTTSGHLSLFDLSLDPGEQHDISEQNPAEARQLHRYLVDAIQGSETEQVDGVAKVLPDDEELVEQLRALGYLD